MVDVPDTQFATTSDGSSIAFQVFGSGSTDLVFVPNTWTHLEAQWEHEPTARCLRRLGTFARVLLFDKRGYGLSDPVAPDAVPSLRAWADDMTAVMDSARSTRAVVMGTGIGGPITLEFAAAVPERVSALVLNTTYARILRAADFPIGVPESLLTRFVDYTVANWGSTGRPALVDSPEVRRQRARKERLIASPGVIRQAMQARFLGAVDVRRHLTAVRVPTLVLHAAHDMWIRSAHGKYLAAHIEGARYVELPVEPGVPSGMNDLVVDEIEEFVTGSRSMVHRRALATVLFTDLVASTELTAMHGDAKWREYLDTHDGVVRRQLARYHGRWIKSTGDGILATFDTPAGAISCTRDIQDGLRDLGLEMRAGLHVGEIEHRGDDITGMAVNIAQRVQAIAGPGDVLVSRTVVDLVAGSGLEFDDRGEHELRGVAGNWHVFAVKE